MIDLKKQNPRAFADAATCHNRHDKRHKSTLRNNA
jgi:hypothetical protein